MNLFLLLFWRIDRSTDCRLAVKLLLMWTFDRTITDKWGSKIKLPTWLIRFSKEWKTWGEKIWMLNKNTKIDFKRKNSLCLCLGGSVALFFFNIWMLMNGTQCWSVFSKTIFFSSGFSRPVIAVITKLPQQHIQDPTVATFNHMA